MFFLNSDVERFVRTFEVFDHALRLGAIDVGTLTARLEELEPTRARASEWWMLAMHGASAGDRVR